MASSAVVANNSTSSKGKSKRRVVAVNLLNGEQLLVYVLVNSRLSDVFSQVVTYLSLRETEYFGLAIAREKDYQFLILDDKVSKVASRHWKTGHEEGRDCDGKSLFSVAFRVQFYVDQVVLLREKLTRHLYYLQLRQNVLDYNHLCSEERCFQICAYALQADKGNFSADKHTVGYFNPLLYFPDWVVKKRGSQYLRDNTPLVHQDLRSMSRSEAELKYIHECSSPPLPHNLHFHKVKRKKTDKVFSIWLAVSSHGVELYDRKKFEIRSVGSFGKCRFSYYTDSDAMSKYLLHICRSTHLFQMAIRPKLMEIRHLDAEDTKRHWETYVYGDIRELQPARRLVSGQSFKSSGNVLSDIQRFSVISDVSSNTTSGIVCDRMALSVDEAEGCMVMPATSTSIHCSLLPRQSMTCSLSSASSAGSSTSPPSPYLLNPAVGAVHSANHRVNLPELTSGSCGQRADIPGISAKAYTSGISTVCPSPPLYYSGVLSDSLPVDLPTVCGGDVSIGAKRAASGRYCLLSAVNISHAAPTLVDSHPPQSSSGFLLSGSPRHDGTSCGQFIDTSVAPALAGCAAGGPWNLHGFHPADCRAVDLHVHRNVVSFTEPLQTVLGVQCSDTTAAVCRSSTMAVLPADTLAVNVGQVFTDHSPDFDCLVVGGSKDVVPHNAVEADRYPYDVLLPTTAGKQCPLQRSADASQNMMRTAESTDSGHTLSDESCCTCHSAQPSVEDSGMLNNSWKHDVVCKASNSDHCRLPVKVKVNRTRPVGKLTHVSVRDHKEALHPDIEQILGQSHSLPFITALCNDLMTGSTHSSTGSNKPGTLHSGSWHQKHRRWSSSASPTDSSVTAVSGDVTSAVSPSSPATYCRRYSWHSEPPADAMPSILPSSSSSHHWKHHEVDVTSLRSSSRSNGSVASSTQLISITCSCDASLLDSHEAKYNHVIARHMIMPNTVSNGGRDGGHSDCLTYRTWNGSLPLA